MGLWMLASLTIVIHAIAAQESQQALSLENRALIVKCRNRGGSVDWFYPQTNKRIPAQENNRVFASGDLLKFLPAQVDDSGIYTCFVRSSDFNKTVFVNVSIYKEQPDCTIPDFLMYSTVRGSEKNSKIYCPTVKYYNWTTPLEWFKNCEALKGPKYQAHEDYLVIDNVTPEDVGDYTCKFKHSENGVSYNVTATRSFLLKVKQGFPLPPVIKTPEPNETKEVDIGKTANLICSACFGKGYQLLTNVLWEVNHTKVEDLNEARFHEEKEENQSSSNELTCQSIVLRIAAVRKEDLQLQYDCVALGLRGVIKHPLRLRGRNPIDRHSYYYIVAGSGMLLMLINVLMIILKVFWIEMILLWRDVVRPYKTRNDGKIYDAYVIYPRSGKHSPEGTSSVEYFVHQILPDVLENKCGYNLCIYGRDLLPGEDAATAVESSIRKSRRHIFILTPQIVHCQDFAYEQGVALHSALIRNDAKVILIEVRDPSQPGGLQVEELQDSLKHIMKVQGTIKWKDDHAANKRSLNSKFWKHVRYQMPVPSKLPRKTSSLMALNALEH